MEEKNFKDSELKETKLSSEEIFRGRLLHVVRDTVKLPNGHETTREYLKHKGAAAVVPINENGEVCVEHQFRYPLGRVITEIPAGKLDGPDEPWLGAAKRELKEETGITADKWTKLGEYNPAAAYTSETIGIYLAEGLHMGERRLDEDEFLNFEFVPLKDLADAVMNGEITDGKSQAGILMAARKFGV